MKKKILGGLAVLAIAAIAAWNVNFSSKTEGMMSDVMLANIQALAQSEGGGSGDCKWKQVYCVGGSNIIEACITVGDGNECVCGTTTRDC